MIWNRATVQKVTSSNRGQWSLLYYPKLSLTISVQGLLNENKFKFQFSYLSCRVTPCQMTEVRINWYSNHSCIHVLKFFNAIAKWNDFRGTDKSAGKNRILVRYCCLNELASLNVCSQVQWIEEQDQIFSFEIVQFNLLKVTIHHSHSFKCWCRFLYICCE